MLIKNISVMVAAMLLAAGCGTNSSDEGGAAQAKNARFFDGNVSGVKYECASGQKGEVKNGSFSCPVKDGSVTFKIGSIVLGTVSVDDVKDPAALVQGNEEKVIAIAQILLSSDSDHNPDNGIQVDASLLGDSTDLANASVGAVASRQDAVNYLKKHFNYIPPASSSSASSVSSASSSSLSSRPSSSKSSQSSDASSASSVSSKPTYVYVPPSSTYSSSSSSSTQVSLSSSASSVSSSIASSSSTIASSSSSLQASSSSSTVSSSSSSYSSSTSSENKSSVSSSSSSVSSSVSSSSSSSQQSLGKTATVETEASEWYVRLVAEDVARGMKTQSAQLGQLEATDAVEKHTLKALRPFGGSYLDIVFKDPNGVSAGEYKVNFHVHEDGSADTWHFTVKTDDKNSDLIITWRGLYVLSPYVDAQGRTRYREYRSTTNPLLEKMQVVDEKSGNVLPAVKNGTAPAFVVNMGGESTRRFRWELLTQNVNTTATSAAPIRIQHAARRFIKEVSEPRQPAFDLNKPPMIEEDIYEK